MTKKPSFPRFFLLLILWWLAQLRECRSTEWAAMSFNLSWTTNQDLKKNLVRSCKLWSKPILSSDDCIIGW